MNIEILGAGLPALTGNAWVDSMLILGATLWFMMLLKKFKGDFWPGIKDAETVKISPNPLHIKKAETVATKDDLIEIKEEIDKIWGEVKEQRSVSRTALGKIHARIDELAKQTDTMSGEMKGELSGIKVVLDKLLERSMR